MSKPRSELKTASRNKPEPKRNEGTVGYGRPPKEHRFKPGHSGNPKGRPRGAKNADTLAREILSRPIKVREGGKERKVSVLEAMLMKFAERGLNGDAKAADFLLKLYRQAEGTTDGEVLDANDREIFDVLLRELEANREEKGKELPDVE
jgi:hypothetical protein